MREMERTNKPAFAKGGQMWGTQVEPAELEQRALTLRTLGWMLLIFDATIISVFIFVGLRSGSLLWMYWAVVQGVLGSALVGAGMVQEARVGELIGRRPEPRVEARDVGEEAA